MKIALIGPAYPYRGGIAHHTNMLAIYLRRHGHTVDVITFSRQYPKFLYPGRAQEEAGEGGEFSGTIHAERMIDSINPLNWLSVGRTLRKRNYDLVIFKYWLPFFAPAFGTIARQAHRKNKRDIMVVFENLIPHERRPGDAILTKFFLRYCIFGITQSKTVKEQVNRLYPKIAERLHPHPVYENFGEQLSRSNARETLGITAGHVLLFFGYVRAYKGLDRLIGAMPELVKRIPDIQLLIVGEFFGSPEPFLQQIRDSGVESHILVVDRYVSNDEVACWFSAADMVVLPYVSATNSGIVMIAYNFSVPAIVTDVGSLSDVVLDGRTGYVIRDASPASIADAVEKMYEPGRIEQFAGAIAEERTKYTWDAFVEGIEELVRT